TVHAPVEVFTVFRSPSSMNADAVVSLAPLPTKARSSIVVICQREPGDDARLTSRYAGRFALLKIQESVRSADVMLVDPRPAPRSTTFGGTSIVEVVLK